MITGHNCSENHIHWKGTCNLELKRTNYEGLRCLKHNLFWHLGCKNWLHSGMTTNDTTYSGTQNPIQNLEREISIFFQEEGLIWFKTGSRWLSNVFYILQGFLYHSLKVICWRKWWLIYCEYNNKMQIYGW